MEHNTPLYNLFVQLRRRRFLLGAEDYFALNQAMKFGFGWNSREALRSLCCSLWAKSRSENEIVTALFDQLELPSWDLAEGTASGSPLNESESSDLNKGVIQAEEPGRSDPEVADAQNDDQIPATHPKRGLPPIDLDGIVLPLRSFVFVPYFPLASRDVAQRWRYLPEAERSGPLEEIDIAATIALRCRQGIPGPLVLRPRKRKPPRLLLLVDRQGSMAAFDRFVEMICEVIQRSARSSETAVFYFHDVPVEGADDKVLASVRAQPFPVLDDLVDELTPLAAGYIYEDTELLSPKPLPEVLQAFVNGGSVVILSDAGAARHNYDVQRILDTLAFLKVLRHKNQRYIWLNPLPVSSWKGSTAEQIARHVPMFPLDNQGLQSAVCVLRNRRRPVENLS